MQVSAPSAQAYLIQNDTIHSPSLTPQGDRQRTMEKSTATYTSTSWQKYFLNMHNFLYVNYCGIGKLLSFSRLSSMLIALLYWWKFRPINIKLLSSLNLGAQWLIWYNTSTYVRVHYIKDKVFLKSILLFLSCKFCFTIKVCLIPLIWDFTLPSPTPHKLHIIFKYLLINLTKLCSASFG